MTIHTFRRLLTGSAIGFLLLADGIAFAAGFNDAAELDARIAGSAGQMNKLGEIYKKLHDLDNAIGGNKENATPSDDSGLRGALADAVRGKPKEAEATLGEVDAFLKAKSEIENNLKKKIDDIFFKMQEDMAALGALVGFNGPIKGFRLKGQDPVDMLANDYLGIREAVEEERGKIEAKKELLGTSNDVPEKNDFINKALRVLNGFNVVKTAQDAKTKAPAQRIQNAVNAAKQDLVKYQKELREDLKKEESELTKKLVDLAKKVDEIDQAVAKGGHIVAGGVDNIKIEPEDIVEKGGEAPKNPTAPQGKKDAPPAPGRTPLAPKAPVVPSTAAHPAQKAKLYSVSLPAVPLRQYVNVTVASRAKQGKALRNISVQSGSVQLKLVMNEGVVSLCLAPFGNAKIGTVAAVLLPAKTLVPMHATDKMFCAPASVLLGSGVSNVKVQFTTGGPVAPAKGPGDEGTVKSGAPPVGGGGKKIVPDPVVVEIEDEVKESIAGWKLKNKSAAELGKTYPLEPNGNPISWDGGDGTISLIDIATGKQTASAELCGELRALLGKLVSDVNDSGMDPDAKAKALAALQAARAGVCSPANVARALAVAFGLPASGGDQLQLGVRGLIALINGLDAGARAVDNLAGDIRGLAEKVVKASSDKEIDYWEERKMEKIEQLRRATDAYNNLKSLLRLLTLELPKTVPGYDYLGALLSFPGRVYDAAVDREATARKNALVGEALSDIQKDGQISSETEKKIQDALKEAKEAGIQ